MKRDAMSRLIQELEPGGTLIRKRRLRGGVGARMDVLEIERVDGTRVKATLRRFTRDNRASQPQHVQHEYKVLLLLKQANITAPRPLLLDARSDLFGVPAIALTYLPGAPLYHARSIASWVEQLATALLQIHAVTPALFDLSWLSVQLRDGVLREIEERRQHTRDRGTLARIVHAVLLNEIDRIEWSQGTLVHDDYWPGNTIWRSGRLVGVVDWTHAEVGDPRTDVSQCRIDIALIVGLDAADAFLRAYQALARTQLRDIWYFDLLRGLRALLSYRFWLAGYHDAGLDYITAPFFRQRIRLFLRRALHERRTERHQ